MHYTLPVFKAEPFFEENTENAIQSFLGGAPTTKDNESIIGVEFEYKAPHDLADIENIIAENTPFLIVRRPDGQIIRHLFKEIHPDCKPLLAELSFQIHADTLSPQSIAYEIAHRFPAQNVELYYNIALQDKLFRLRRMNGFSLLGYEYPGSKDPEYFFDDAPTPRDLTAQDDLLLRHRCFFSMNVNNTNSAHEDMELMAALPAYCALAQDILNSDIDGNLDDDISLIPTDIIPDN